MVESLILEDTVADNRANGPIIEQEIELIAQAC